MFQEEIIKSEWPQIVKAHGLFVVVSQHRIVHRELGVTKNARGQWRLLNIVHYGNGWPALSSPRHILAIRVRLCRSVTNDRV